VVLYESFQFFKVNLTVKNKKNISKTSIDAYSKYNFLGIKKDKNYIYEIKRRADILKKRTYQPILKRFKEKLIKSNNKEFNFMELGSGPGRRILPKALYCKNKKNINFYAIAGTKKHLEILKKFQKKLKLKNIKTYNTFLEDINVLIKNKKIPKFDFIECNGVIHHTEDWEKILSLTFNLLKDDGFFLLAWCDPTLEFGWFHIKNQIAHRLGKDAKSRIKIGKSLFGYFDKKRYELTFNTNLFTEGWESWLADRYAVYYRPITPWKMREVLKKNNFEIIDENPPTNFSYWKFLENPTKKKKFIIRLINQFRILSFFLSIFLNIRGFVTKQNVRTFFLKKKV